jgi:hypothetical protein
MLPRMSMQKECAPKEEKLPETHLDASLEVPLSGHQRIKKKHNADRKADTTVANSVNREWIHTVTANPFTPWWCGHYGSRFYAVLIGRHSNPYLNDRIFFGLCRLDPTSMKVQEKIKSLPGRPDNLSVDFAVTEVPEVGVILFSMPNTRTTLEWSGISILSSSLKCTNEQGWARFSVSNDRVILASADDMVEIYDININGNTLSLRQRNRFYAYAPPFIDHKGAMHPASLQAMTIDKTNRVILNYGGLFFMFTASLDTYILPYIIKTYEDNGYDLITVSDNLLFGVRTLSLANAVDRMNYPLVMDVYRVTRDTITHIREHEMTINGVPRTFFAINKQSLILGTDVHTYNFQLQL